MTSDEYVRRLEVIASRRTYYSNKYPHNLCYIHPDGRTSADCWNLIKAILNGYDVNRNEIGYFQKKLSNTGDCGIDGLFRQCKDVSSDFSRLKNGEPRLLGMPGHAGSFIGERVIDGRIYNVIECTGSWERKVLYSWVDPDGTRRHYKGGAKHGKWTKHGKMTAWLDYGNSAQTSENTANQVANDLKEEIIMPTIKKGNKGKTVKIWQIIVGASPDGEFGPITDSKTREFQKAHGLEVDGIVGPKSWKAGFDSVR
jgi:hypothetical protein